jgi:hypothetical protein
VKLVVVEVEDVSDSTDDAEGLEGMNRSFWKRKINKETE